jgi:YfiH family protein
MSWFRFQTRNAVEFVQISLPGTKGVFSTRNGGISTPPFDSLNLAFHVGDAPEAVTANRRIFSAAAGFSLENLVCAQQVHGTRVFSASFQDRGKGVYCYEDAVSETDALITDDSNVVLGAFFADCVPVFIADPVRKAVGLAHAGWKGTLHHIAQKTVAKMTEEFGCVSSDCFAFIGPSIGPCCYRVGEEVIALLDPALAAHVSSEGEDKKGFKLDLWGANRADLLVAGLSADNIAVSGLCTRCDARFFSFRRAGGQTGRMGGFIGLI